MSKNVTEKGKASRGSNYEILQLNTRPLVWQSICWA